MDFDDMLHMANDIPERLVNMRGCVTGATGWFGTWVCSALDYIGADYVMLDTRKLKPVDCDWCIHLAHGESQPLIDMLLKTNVQHVLFTSSGAVYDRELSGYGRTKLTHENQFLESGLPVNIARCFTLTGKGVCRKTLAIGEFINAAKNGEPLEVYNGGKTIRTYMYMADLVIWLLNLLVADKGNIIDVGGDQPISILELAQMVIDRMGGQMILSDNFYMHEARPYYVPNIKRAAEFWLYVHTNIETAIDKTIKSECA